jgi:ATP-binding cassette, subfamily C, bacterial
MSETRRSSLRTILFFLEKYPTQNIFVIGALLLSGFAETLGIGSLLPLINIVVGGNGDDPASKTELMVRDAFSALGLAPTLEVLLSIIVIMIILKAVIFFAAMRYVSHIAADISRQVRLRLIRALMRARWGYFSSMVLGHVSNAVSEQAQRAGHCYMLAARAGAAFLQILIYIGLAFLISFEVSILAIILGGALAFALKILIRMARSAGQDMTDSMNSMLAVFSEALAGVKPIKAMGQEERFIRHMESDTRDVLKAQKKQYSATLLLQVIHEPVIVVLMACGLYYVLTFTDTPVNDVFLLAFLFYRLMGQASVMQGKYQGMAQTESALWGLVTLSEAAEREAEILPTGGDTGLKEKICFEDLGISYNGRDFLLRHFSGNIPAGKVTLLFGPSGVGKTTLTDVVLGMHTPQEGWVTVDDVPMNEIDLKIWRGKIGYVPQDTFLFHDTVRQNVTLGNADYTDEDVETALKDAAAWEFVKDLPEGIETVVGERGGRLSGGQRQRIALARSLIRRPALLILDEATTGLDAESERLVFESIGNLKGRTTVIMISHNPSLKKLADKVIYLGTD